MKNRSDTNLCIIQIIKPNVCQVQTAEEATFSRGLFNHFEKGLFVPMVRVDLFEIKSFGHVRLHCVKRAENQSFHLQLVDVVQLFFKPYRGRKKNRSAVRECEMSFQCKFSQMGRDKRTFACECEEGQEVRGRGHKAGERL